MAPKELSVGKLRGLQELLNPRGIFTLLGVDDRESLRTAFSASAPDEVSDETLVEFKLLLTRVLAPYVSGVLLDPLYGAPQAIGQAVLPGSTGLIVSLESSDYEGEPGARRTRLIPGWDVGKAKRMGASAVKLLIYHHPEALTAPQQEAVAEAVGQQCLAYDIPLLLEPMSYALDPAAPKGSIEFARHRPHVVQDSAMHLTPLGADVLLAEFPAHLQTDGPLRALEQCRLLSAAIDIPWVLVSSEADFELYRQQVEIACQGGASGFLAGHAVWQEMTSLPRAQWEAFAETTVVNRLQTLSDVANAEARAYWPRAEIQPEWLATYSWEPTPVMEALVD